MSTPTLSTPDTSAMVAAHIRTLCHEPGDYAVATIVELAFTDVTCPGQDSDRLEPGQLNRMKVPAVGLGLFELIVQSSRVGEGQRNAGQDL